MFLSGLRLGGTIRAYAQPADHYGMSPRMAQAPPVKWGGLTVKKAGGQPPRLLYAFRPRDQLSVLPGEGAVVVVVVGTVVGTAVGIVVTVTVGPGPVGNTRVGSSPVVPPATKAVGQVRFPLPCLTATL